MAGNDKTPWSVIPVPEVNTWRKTLSPEDAARVQGAINTLERVGPTLGRPYVDRIKGSRYHNMKELRPLGGNIRVLFAFDRRSQGVLLVGGDKTNNWKGWYKDHIPVADKRYARHLRSHGEGGDWSIQRQRGRGR